VQPTLALCLTSAALAAAPQDAELDAFLASLDPPPVEEIVATLGEVASREALLARLRDLASRADDPRDVAALEEDAALHERLNELESAGEVEQALAVALELQALRQGAERRVPWACDQATRRIALLELVLSLPPEERAAASAGRAAYFRSVELTNAARPGEALEEIERAVALLAQGPAGLEPALAMATVVLAAREREKGDAASSERLGRHAWARCRELLGEADPSTADCLGGLGYALLSQARLGEAELLVRAGIERLLEPEEPDWRTLIHLVTMLAHVELVRGERDAATRLWQAAHEAASRVPALREETRISCLSNYGAALLYYGDRERGEPLLTEAIERGTELWGEGSLAVVEMKGNLGTGLDRVGRHAEAEAVLREALAPARRWADADELTLAFVQNNLGFVLRRRGAFEEAELLLRRSLDTRRRVLGDQDPVTALTAQNLAVLLVAKGDSAAALPLAEEVLAYRRATFQEPHEAIADTLTTVAAAHELEGDLERALQLHRDALEMRRELLGGEHVDVARSSSCVGRLLWKLGADEEAEPLLARALAIYASSYGARSPWCAYELGALGVVARHRGDPARAVELFQRALAIHAEAFGADSRACAHGLANLAAACWELDRRPEALRHYERALDLFERLRTQVAGGELERARFSEQLGHRELAALLSRLYLGEDRPADALEAAERGRARVLLDLLLRSTRDLAALAGEADPERARELEALAVSEEAARRERIEAERALALADLEGGATGAQRARVADASLHGARLEAELLARVRAASPDASVASAAEIRAALLPGEWLLSFVWERGGVHALLVPPAGAGEVRGEVLASGADETAALGARLRALGEALATDPRRRASAATAAGEVTDVPDVFGLARALVPSSLAALLPGIERLLVSPDGPLAAFPWELLLAASLDDPGSAPDVAYVQSGTILIDRRRAERALASVDRPRALVLGDPRFARDAAGAPGTARTGHAETEALARLYGSRLEPLPASRVEARRVAELLERSGVAATVLVGEDASLAELEAGVRGARFVHLATHGLSGTDARPYDASLALAAPESPSADDFGFLTLERLLREWRGKLAGCELVVLSACDTQRGVDVGDSRMALPWGFFYAGAPTVVASLWKVDDVATALLMARFYDELLGPEAERLPPVAALRAAKEWLRGVDRRTVRRLAAELGLAGDSRAREAGGAAGEAGGSQELRPFADPFFWAGFVVIGSPGARSE